MALTDENGGNGMIMPVQPMGYGGNFGGYGNGGFGFGGDWAWILLLLLIGGNGWGMGGFGGGYGAMMGAGMMGIGYEFPWLLAGQTNTDNNVNSGFRDAQLQDSVTSVRDGISALSTQLCGCCGDMQMSMANGFAGVNQNVSQTGNAIQNAVNQGFASTNLGIANGLAGVNQNISQGFASTNLGMCQGFNGVNTAISGAQNALAQQMYTNQIADLERSYNAQTANTAGLNAIQAQQAQCCCDTRAGIADTKYTIATEACATRTADAQNARDIIDAQNRGTQAILDKLCALELDGVKNQLAQAQRENVGLQNQVNMATMQASQTAQTAQILAGQAAEIDGVYNRLKNCPVPSMPVYGNTPIFTCNSGCGCNGGNF